jgi:hypothetical protein
MDRHLNCQQPDRVNRLTGYSVAHTPRLAMLVRDVAQTSARGPVPTCIICKGKRSVRHLACLTVGDAACWTCDDCLVSWTTDNSPRSTAADRSARKFA